MDDFQKDSVKDLLARIKDAQLAAENLIHENDQALEWAFNELNRYKNLLVYVLLFLKGKPIYWAHPEWKKIVSHTITDVRMERQVGGFFGEEFDGEIVVKIFVDDDDSYYIAETLGETLFFTLEDAQKVAGTAKK